VTWRVRLRWVSSGPFGDNHWETGGDFGMPDGTDWAEAVRACIEARDCGHRTFYKVEAEVLD
jgi:hypothetical protein